MIGRPRSTGSLPLAHEQDDETSIDQSDDEETASNLSTGEPILHTPSATATVVTPPPGGPSAPTKPRAQTPPPKSSTAATFALDALPPPSDPSKLSKSKNSVQVICRFRPQSEDEMLQGGNMCVETEGPNTCHINIDERRHSFKYDRVFDVHATQSDVYSEIGGNLIDAVVWGFHASLIAYGQTGPLRPHPGRPATEEYTVTASFLQIYNEKLQDLLSPEQTDLQIQEGCESGIWVAKATEVPVHDPPQALAVYKRGIANRTVAETEANKFSSRSHAIFVLTVVHTDLVERLERRAQIYMADLAGSERVDKSHTQGERLNEAKRINTSLLALGKVIFALTAHKKKEVKHVPYRDSKLTRLLRHSFGGNARTFLILCCSPSTFNGHESLSTLRFGARASRIKNKPVANEQRSVEQLTLMLGDARREIEAQRVFVGALQQEIAALRAGLGPDTALGCGVMAAACPPGSGPAAVPLTHHYMTNPVVSFDGPLAPLHVPFTCVTPACDFWPCAGGRADAGAVRGTYEKDAIEEHLKAHEFRSPVTKAKIPNYLALSLIRQLVSPEQLHQQRFLGNLDYVPHEIWLLIFTYVDDAKTLRSLSKVCRAWAQVCQSERLWRMRYDKEFGEPTDPFGAIADPRRRTWAFLYWERRRLADEAAASASASGRSPTKGAPAPAPAPSGLHLTPSAR
ncbi:putative Kinesin heavy chain [Paratrimastix pyriformis]|uniref:Kinesin heavy chain n=1 Tax=Paratrimastix pyriformis TaxID=342808 RepID=A0ABQ8UP20_9EUKA|nr:putative Kinesin heavy chain [Paratrimastix pyriformis]